MKEKVLIFLTGLLLGAIISTGSIYLYTVAEGKNNQVNNPVQNNDFGNRGQKNQNWDMGTPPEAPNDNGQPR